MCTRSDLFPFVYSSYPIYIVINLFAVTAELLSNAILGLLIVVEQIVDPPPFLNDLYAEILVDYELCLDGEFEPSYLRWLALEDSASNLLIFLVSTFLFMSRILHLFS
jgi:hypothetical protein